MTSCQTESSLFNSFFKQTSLLRCPFCGFRGISLKRFQMSWSSKYLDLCHTDHTCRMFKDNSTIFHVTQVMSYLQSESLYLLLAPMSECAPRIPLTYGNYPIHLLLHCTMCTLGSMFSFQPNKLRHILKVASWWIIQHIFVSTCLVGRKTWFMRKPWVPNSIAVNSPKIWPCSRYRAILWWNSSI